jgi:Ser/Thr protein kinase RdoA (MazF antagonist)
MASRTVTKSADSVPYAGLSPERVLAIAERIGLVPDGRLFALNSYENRVYRVGCEDAPVRVLKFYRAGRWSDAQILEEHTFATELAAADLPVAAPEALGGLTLHHCEGFRVAVFPLCPGGAPDLDAPDTLPWLGRTLARLHACGAQRPFRERQALRGEALGSRARRVVLDSPQLPGDCQRRYADISAALLQAIDACWDECAPVHTLRLHGDCHLGNILWNERGPLFVDLDDCRSGPAMQDLWMFLSGDGENQRRQWAALLEGYERFADFDFSELGLIEALRATRMLNHTAWIAERWADPAFPRAFPEFAEPVYWQRHVNDLAEQLEAVAHPPILSH